MALNAFQQAVSDLAKSLGLKGAAEQQVYQRPEFIALVERLYGKIPLPPGVVPSQVTRNDGLVLEYTDAQGYTHRLQRDVNGASPNLGQVQADQSDRPPILPPNPQQAGAEKALSTGLLGNLGALFGIPTGATGQSQPSQLGSGRTIGTLTGGTSPQAGPRTLGNLFSNVPQVPQSNDPYRQTQRPPALPDLTQVLSRLNNLPSAPQLPDFSALQNQLSQGFGAPPALPDLSAITGG